MLSWTVAGKASVERAVADKTQGIAVGCTDKMEMGSITVWLVVRQVVIQDEVLNALLLGFLGLLLVQQGDSEARVRRQVDRASLEAENYYISHPYSINYGLVREITCCRLPFLLRSANFMVPAPFCFSGGALP